MDLLIDQGNTATKYHLWQGDQLIDQGEVANQAIDSFDWPSADQVVLASVAKSQWRIALLDRLEELNRSSLNLIELHSEPVFKGLVNAYQDASQIGVDRWLALIAAREICPMGVDLISLGTAMTMDRIEINGKHRGSRIAPGWQMMQNALGQETGKISLSEKNEKTRMEFGVNTQQAVTSGVETLIRGGLKSWLDEGSQSVIITGGGAKFYLDLWSRYSVIWAHDLVLRGMKIWLNAEKPK